MFAASIGALAVAAGPVAAIGIDIPIHLNEETDRPCDAAARRLIAPCGSRVFNAPVRDVLAAKTYDEALRISRGRCGKGISKQTWHLVPKIAEVEAWFAGAPSPVYEVFPEAAFRAMAVASWSSRSAREKVRPSGAGRSSSTGSAAGTGDRSRTGRPARRVRRGVVDRSTRARRGRECRRERERPGDLVLAIRPRFVARGEAEVPESEVGKPAALGFVLGDCVPCVDEPIERPRTKRVGGRREERAVLVDNRRDRGVGGMMHEHQPPTRAVRWALMTAERLDEQVVAPQLVPAGVWRGAAKRRGARATDRTP